MGFNKDIDGIETGLDVMLQSALHNVRYHPVRDERQADMQVVRDAAQGFLFAVHRAMEGTSPASSREKAMAYRSVEDAVMYAIAGIARHGVDPTHVAPKSNNPLRSPDFKIIQGES